MNSDTDCPVISATGTEADTSTHTSDRKSARPQRIEVITRGERRRRWSLEEKQAIVADRAVRSNGKRAMTTIAATETLRPEYVKLADAGSKEVATNPLSKLPSEIRERAAKFSAFLTDIF